jgi:dCMP deaminase
MNWKEYFLGIAHQVKLKSKDQYTQIGAVIVGKDNEVVSTGYNSFPRGIDDERPERQERPEKYHWFEHAERNAIYNAARIGVSTKDTTMYLTCGLPCTECCRGIINAGITKVVCSTETVVKGEHYKEMEEKTKQMFFESGVVIEYY